MQPTRDEIDEVTRLVRRALGPYNLKPSAEDIASLTDDLSTHGQRHVARAQAIRKAHRVTGALQDWHDLMTHGPEGDLLGNWNYARSIARVVRTLHNALLEEGRRRELIVRTALPPIVDRTL
ncbi:MULTISPECIES: DUF6415 family natural product biosynthesis protein [unclassified Streptomyces]|uniref:DUF6415 family natural product biosynthesis protein n=1 Tax=unclassified Streptomyces TaxID=2593676 RepID=UPI001BE9490B|nr:MULTISPECIES: DUF6415 family natural product biosynthesis protein [unclassified Streptomyces]MBT2403952.1 hypothetical protein [Streptomyces sp. ISL-21]MBT2608393.1 hypothetical protein [Streptomyces sp. ISL-87]